MNRFVVPVRRRGISNGDWHVPVADSQRREGRDVLTLIRQASMELGLPIAEVRDDVEPDIQWRIARQAMISHFQRINKPSHRVKLPGYNTIEDVVSLIQKSSKVRWMIRLDPPLLGSSTTGFLTSKCCHLPNPQ